MGNCSMTKEKLAERQIISKPGDDVKTEVLEESNIQDLKNYTMFCQPGIQPTADFDRSSETIDITQGDSNSQNVFYGRAHKSSLGQQQLNIIQIQKSLSFQSYDKAEDVSGEATPSLNPHPPKVFKKQITFFDRCQQLKQKSTVLAAPEEVLTSIEGALKVKVFKVKLENGHYQGEWANGKREGYGKHEEADGSIYSGHWKNDKAHGKGIYQTKSEQYQGHWRDGVIHGEGKLYDRIKKCYFEGCWSHGQMRGSMRQFWDDGTKFYGKYELNMRNGTGRLQFPDGSYYEGEFKNNFIDGKGMTFKQYVGTYCWVGRRTYTGTWRENNMEGHGIIQYADGSSYEGQFLNDKKEGMGTCKWPDGSHYTGQWFKDKHHGYGVLTTAEGLVKKGQWMFGKFKQSIEQK